MSVILTLRAEKWVQNGFCLAHDEAGRPVFVHGALPGEKVQAEVDRERSTHRFARTVRVIEKATGRIEPECSAFGSCGGCSFRHLSYADECALKQELLGEFVSLRGLRERDALAFFASPPDGYRTAVRVHRAGDRLGLFALHSNEIVPLPPEGCRQLAEGLREAVLSAACAQSPSAEHARAAGVEDLRFLVHAGGVAGEEEHRRGDIITIAIDSLTWRLAAGSFVQSNGALLPKWLEWIRSNIPDGKPDCVELFCGTGLISGFARARLGRVFGLDSHARSIVAARENFRTHGFEGSFMKRDLYGHRWTAPDTSLLICNPPRAGLKEATLKAIGSLRRLRHVLYSSCNPATLERDLQKMARMGWELRTGAAFDFFPRTPHLEVVVLLERGRKRRGDR